MANQVVLVPLSFETVTVLHGHSPVTMETASLEATGVGLPSLSVIVDKLQPSFAVEFIFEEESFIPFSVIPRQNSFSLAHL